MRKLLALLALLPGLAQAAITYIGAGTASNAIDGGAVTPSVHASTTTGDLIVCAVGQKNGTDYTVLTSSGYTMMYGSNARAALAVLAKIATGSDSVSIDSSDNTAGRTVISQCATFRGTLNTVTGIVDASATTDNTTQANLNTPALDVTVANSVVLIIGLRENQFAAEDMAVLSGMDAEIGQPERTSSAQVAMVWDYDIQTTASDKSASAWVTTVNTPEAVSVALNLKEAATTPTFSVAPDIGTRTTSSITVRATSDTTGTIYGARYTDGGSTPTCDQIEAQTVTGAAQYCSVAATATVAADCVFSSITDGTLKDSAYCLEDASANDSAVATIADTYKTAAWTTAPTVTAQGTGDYTITKVLDGAGSCTAVACAKDATAPTVAQTLAGNCTGDVAAIATVTDASCEAGTMTLGSSLTRPVHDVYVAGTYGSQNSALTTLADECLDAATGKTIVNCPTGLTSIHANSPINGFNTSVTPDIVAGDIMVADSATDLGDALTWTATGLYSYDGNSARRVFSANFYDLSSGANHADTMQVCVNNAAPVASVAYYDAVVVKDHPFTAIDFCAMFSDADDATLTCTSDETGTGAGAGTRPAGTTMTAGVFDDTGSGATSADGSTGSLNITATDSCGDTATIPFGWSVYSQVTVPDCVAGSLSSCMTALSAVNLDTSFESQCSATVAALNVISQTPAASTVVDPFTGVSLVVSSGACGGRRGRLMLGIGVR